MAREMSIPALVSYGASSLFVFLLAKFTTNLIAQGDTGMGSIIEASKGLEGPMLMAFLIVCVVVWFLSGISKNQNESMKETAKTNRESATIIADGFTKFRVELSSDIDGLKNKQDEHTQELSEHRNEITKLTMSLPSVCKSKDED